MGLALLQRQGVAAWAKAWQEIAPVAPVRSPAAHGADDDGLVGVLASMALACLGKG